MRYVNGSVGATEAYCHAVETKRDVPDAAEPEAGEEEGHTVL